MTVTDATASNNGQEFLNFTRNRNNESAWFTTGSNDAANTQIDIDLGVSIAFDRFFLVSHNLKSYTVQYYDGSTYVDFSTPISETTNSLSTNEYIFDSIEAQYIRIVITGTQVADSDKEIKQIIVTNSIGQLMGWPQVRKATYDLNKSTVALLSGKNYVSRQRGGFSFEIRVSNYNIDSDIEILEQIYFSPNSVLVWINAGDSSQFSRTHVGYRPQDIFLMTTRDEFEAEFYKYLYQAGLKFRMQLVEVTS